MPKLTDDLETFNLQTSRFGFSGTKIENLGATEYTLVTIAVDESGSVSMFKNELEQALKEVVNSCKTSPRADNLLIRLVSFSSDFRELHGFKLLSEINLADYDNVLNVGGMTALLDSIENSVEATMKYGKSLLDNDFLSNGLVVVITDGLENNSKATETSVKTVLESAVKNEIMESLTSILIGVNTGDQGIGMALQNLQQACGINQYIDIQNADSKSIAKLANFISRSISSSSQALGTGGPSQLLTF